MLIVCSLSQTLSMYFNNSGSSFTILVLSYSLKRTANYFELNKIVW